MKISLFLMVFIITTFLFSASATDYTIDDNTVYINDNEVYLSAYPHTLNESGYVYFNLTSKQYSGNIDFFFGFNSLQCKPISSEIFIDGNWIDISHRFNSVNYDYDNLNKWYYLKEIPIYSNTNYTLRAYLKINEISTGGKYGVAIKPSSETISQAINNSHFYYLDPWWNGSWNYRKTITLTGPTFKKSYNNPIEDGYVKKTSTPTYERFNTGNNLWSGNLINVYRSYIEWDISSLPSDANILYASLKYEGMTHDGDAHIHAITNRPSISSNLTLWNDMGDGYIYADETGFPIVTTNKEIVLSSQSHTDIESAITNGWFAIGLQSDDELYVGRSSIASEEEATATPKPTLYIEYASVTEGGGQTDYQLLLNVTYDSDMQSGFDDLRFTNDTHQVDAWLESKVDSEYTLIWVEFPTTPASGVNQDYYMYYGNASVVSNWDIAATFVFGDDFSGDLSKWSFTDTQGVGGSAAIVSERLEIRSKTGNKHVGVSSLNFSNGILEVDIEGDPNINYQWVGVGFGDSETNHFLSHRIYANAQQARAEWNVGSGWQSAGTISATWTTWYAKNIMTGSIAKMYGKQSKGDSWTVFKEDLSYSSTVPIRLVSFDDNSGGVDGIGYFDNVRLRKYAINFPTYVFGSEERQIYVSPTPINLQNTTGNFWINHTWQAGAGNVTDSYNISVNDIWHNETINTYWNITYGYGNNSWQNITIWAYNNSGTGNLSINSISQNTQLLFTNLPTDLQKIHDHTWINWTWSESFIGTHIIDSYNVSINGTWYNSTTNQFYNHTELDYGITSSIIVYGYNDTQGLSIYCISGSYIFLTKYKIVEALKQLVTPIQIIKDKFFNIIPFIISIILFAGFGLAIMVMTSRLKKW